MSRLLRHPSALVAVLALLLALLPLACAAIQSLLTP